MSVPNQEHKLQIHHGPLKLASLLAGVILVWFAADPARLPPLSISVGNLLMLGLGIVLVGWGAKDYVRRTLSVRPESPSSQGIRRYRVHGHREAYAYALILMVIGLGAMLGKSNLLLLVFGLMAGPFVLGGQITLLILNRLQVTRVLPEYGIAGQRFSVRIRLANRKPLLSAWMVEAIDCVRHRDGEYRPAVLFTRVPPHAARETMYVVCPANRGRYRFGPMRVKCGFPLGLVARSFELGETQELIVYPRIGRLLESWHAASRHGIRSTERALAHLGSSEEEFHRLREYRSGDNPRAIHWRTTARRSELMVREYQHQGEPDLCLILDLWQPDQPTDIDRQRVELAVSFCATVCTEQLQAAGDADLHLVICGQEPVQAVGNGQTLALQALLEKLALVEANSKHTIVDSLRHAATLGDFPMRQVLVTSRPTSDATAIALSARDGAEQNHSSIAGLQVICCDPQQLQEYVHFDDVPSKGFA